MQALNGVDGPNSSAGASNLAHGKRQTSFDADYLIEHLHRVETLLIGGGLNSSKHVCESGTRQVMPEIQMDILSACFHNSMHTLYASVKAGHTVKVCPL